MKRTAVPFWPMILVSAIVCLLYAGLITLTKIPKFYHEGIHHTNIRFRAKVEDTIMVNTYEAYHIELRRTKNVSWPRILDGKSLDSIHASECSDLVVDVADDIKKEEYIFKIPCGKTIEFISMWNRVCPQNRCYQ